MNVGLTGGIASGKSTVVRLFQKKGAYLIDFDVLVRSVEEPGAPAWEKIVENFGSEILSENGTIDREKLGAVVFRERQSWRSSTESYILSFLKNGNDRLLI